MAGCSCVSHHAVWLLDTLTRAGSRLDRRLSSFPHLNRACTRAAGMSGKTFSWLSNSLHDLMKELLNVLSIVKVYVTIPSAPRSVVKWYSGK